jgi:hypothetical protein
LPEVPLTARVVEVLADLGEGHSPRYRVGSGCIVAGRTVLTAAHVVAGATGVQVRDPGKVLHPAVVDPVFLGDAGGPGPDLALVQTTDPESGELPPMGLAAVDRDSAAGDPVERCHVIGYPQFMERPAADGSRVRDTVDAVGHVPVLSGLAGGLLTVQVSNTPRPLPPGETALGNSEWSGISGGPVIADGLLLAVVTEHAPRAGPSAITATPLTALEADPIRPHWGPGVTDPGAWWARLGVSGVQALQKLPGRLRPDIRRLRDLTLANVQTPAAALTISAPEGPVALVREVEPAIMDADGNLAITGAPGAGKTVLLHRLAAAQEAAAVDLVLLRAENLGSSTGKTRTELNITHDLGDVLTGWTGTRPGVLLIDGLDQTRGADAPVWLPGLARALSKTRWRIVATIRTFDLKHGPQWRAMFAGGPAAASPDEELADVRHLVVGDLTDKELAPLRQASPRLADLLDQAGPRLRALLANPFNLDLAGRLLTESRADLLTVHSRVDLLDRYWQSRVSQGAGNLDRVRTLRELVRLMLADGRQAANPLSLPTGVTSESLEALQHDGVLRDLPQGAGIPLRPVTFAHPVLFDYAVAVLALGDTAKPDSMAEVLDGNPNLAVTVRPSLDYRLASVWAADSTRRSFWQLALRLASSGRGHPLAAAAAARVAAAELAVFPDIEELAHACTGARPDPGGAWGPPEASGLTFLVAASIASMPHVQPALDTLGALTRFLAAHARSTDDLNLALLAAQLPLRAVNMQQAALHARPGSDWTAAAVDCMQVALADLGDPRRAALASPAGRFLAAVAVGDPHATAEVVHAVLAPSALTAWGVTAVWPLIEQIPGIARTAPALAIAIGAAVWEYEEPQETQDTATPLIDSGILGLTSNRRQDLEGARHVVATKFPALLDASPADGADLLAQVAELPRMYRWDNTPLAGDRPQLQIGDPFSFAGGDRALPQMTDAFIRKIAQLAETGDDTGSGSAGEIVSTLLARLHNSEVWQRLLHYAAKVATLALSRALLPALASPSLYAHPSTWVAAGHIAARLSSSLDLQTHLRLENAILQLPETWTGAHQAEVRIRLEQRRRVLLGALDPEKISTHAREVLVGDQAGTAAQLPELPDNPGDPVSFRMPEVDPPPGTFEDLSRRVGIAVQQITDRNPETRADGFSKLIHLWPELKNAGPQPGGEAIGEQPAELRLQAAEHLAIAPEVTPGTELGSEVFACLLAALSTAMTGNGDADEAGPLWDSIGAWTITPGTSAIQGLVMLMQREDWRAAHGSEIATLLTPLLDSTHPVHRYLASQALPVLRPEPDNLIDELDQRLHSETDEKTAAVLMNLLARRAPSRPKRADQVLERLAALPRWIVLTPSPDGDQEIGPADLAAVTVDLLTMLAAWNNTPYARTVVRAWLSRPLANPQRTTRAMISLRNLINPAKPSARQVQNQAFALLALPLDELRATALEAEQAATTSEVLRERLTSAIRIANHLAEHLYFASGTFDPQTPPQPSTLGGDLNRFSTLALPLLDKLSAIHYPAVTHHIVQTIDHISAAQPRQALLIAAKAVTADPAYPREILGLDATIQLIQHYTADHRDLVLNDPQCTTAIRTLLETFIRLGWDKAARLAEDLDELFT